MLRKAEPLEPWMAGSPPFRFFPLAGTRCGFTGARPFDLQGSGLLHSE
jgi:hypothetical protein